MTTWLQTAVSSDGTPYRDLNHNGVMDPYEDPRLPIAERVRDLISRMTVPEKVGQLFQRQAEVGADGSLVEEGAVFLPEGTTHAIHELHLTHLFAFRMPKDARTIALWNNRLQKVAEGTRLGIPITLSADPVHHDVHNAATAVRVAAFSAWPEPLGLAALGDVDMLREFADTVRREYAAVGIRSTLQPQVDLATEPRWGRQSGTFGADAALTASYARAFVEACQQTSSPADPLGATSVACTVKHFPGGGPQKDGEDPHFPYGREQVYPGGGFDHHLRPFLAAIESGVAAVMPYYSLPLGLERNGRPVEPVGFAFNKDVITGILREELGYDGVVCTDFGIISDYTSRGVVVAEARAWGVEHLDRRGRIAKALDAGCDQFGGESCTDELLSLVADGLVEQKRLDESLVRLLTLKFELGLFDDPYVDVEAAPSRVGDVPAVSAGFGAQVSSLVLLRDTGPMLPLKPATRVYVEGADATSFEEALTVVPRPEEAEVIVIRLPAPFEERTDYILEQFFHAGTLEFSIDVIERVQALASFAPVVVDVRLERPAVLTPLVDLATVLVGSFGSSDRALARGLTTTGALRGRLPFHLPRSMASVERSHPDSADDLDDVLYRRGHSWSEHGDPAVRTQNA